MATSSKQVAGVCKFALPTSLRSETMISEASSDLDVYVDPCAFRKDLSTQ